MRKSIQILFLAFVAVALASCDMFNKTTPSYSLSDLQGLWQRNNTQEFVRFTTEQSDETGYFLGCEWDEAEDVTEQDRIDARNELGHPGNGWFKYQFKSTGDLTEIHLMDNGGAEIPKIYVVSKLTDTDLVYYEKEYPSIKFNFTKVVTTK
ncbi:MAG: hypothetical protein IJ047_01525 [Paludibacteraceae bacterium]|nr:hypothetical protein [Paludibacteraceae bacterium]